MNRHCPLSFEPTTTPVINIIRDVARDTRIPSHLILSPLRTRPVVVARHTAIRLTKARNPHMSSPQIGDAFGMDHTSILYVLGLLKRKPRWVDA